MERPSGSSEEQVHEFLETTASSLGFEFFLYASFTPTRSVGDPTAVVITNYPAEWWERYCQAGYLAIDPVVAHCSVSISPIAWTELRSGGGESEPVRGFWEEAADCGLASGGTNTLRGMRGEVGLLSVGTDDTRRRATEAYCRTAGDLQLTLTAAHEAVTRRQETQGIVSRLGLSPREAECLYYAADGLDSRVIADKMCVSYHTVVTLFRSIYEKIDTNRKTDAVARWLCSPERNPFGLDLKSRLF